MKDKQNLAQTWLIFHLRFFQKSLSDHNIHKIWSITIYEDYLNSGHQIQVLFEKCKNTK